MTFFSYDDEVEPDERDVLSVSAILDITEFRVFELAYERWFGERGAEDVLERAFSRYMFNTVAPMWVRKFCRDVLEAAIRGNLVPAEFGVVPAVASESAFQRGVRYLAIVAFVTITLHLVAILVTLH